MLRREKERAHALVLHSHGVHKDPREVSGLLHCVSKPNSGPMCKKITTGFLKCIYSLPTDLAGKKEITKSLF